MKVTKYFNPRLNQYGYYVTDANGDIKALTYEDGLKQGMVMLEQIRAEIEDLSTDSYITDGVTCYGKRPLTAEELKEQAFEIIDKAMFENVEVSDGTNI